jgi:hypothetical protein
MTRRNRLFEAARRLRPLLRDTGGAVTMYLAAFSVFAIGAGVVVVDAGRLAVLRSQMQDRADAGALAGAVALNSHTDARARATSLAIDAMVQQSGIPRDQAELSVAAVNFYLDYTNGVVATSDEEAAFIEVVLQPRNVQLFLKPVLDMWAGVTGDSSTALAARAVARSKPFICHAPPLMLCDFAEEDPSLDLSLAANTGRQVRLKEPQSGGSGTWAPGNFGLLALPDGSSGASDIEGALAAVSPSDCYGIDVITATGSKTSKVKHGINARFDVPGNSWPDPAPDVINYPRDADIIADPAAKLGNGTWDLAGYWLDKHGTVPPSDLTGATRYQTYLYELGLPYARDGKQTIYPVSGPVPGGYTLVTPPAADVPVAADPALADDNDHDGVPSTAAASNGYARRLVQVAQLQCIAEGINGHGTYPTSGNYVEIFLTETVKDPPDAAIYGEVVRPLTTINSPEFYANVRLVE